MIGVISDVHGNLEALEAVLREFERFGVEEILFLGDSVGYGANPKEVIYLLRDYTSVSILGNHDAAVLKLENLENYNEYARASLIWTMENLTDDALLWLKGLGFKETYRKEILMVHSAPTDPRSWKYLFTFFDIWDQFNAFKEWMCLFGHTHIQAAYTLEEGQIRELSGEKIVLEKDHRYLINPGSVGQPRDGDPRAAFLIFDPENLTIHMKRVEYNVKETQRKIMEAGLPLFLARRLKEGV